MHDSIKMATVKATGDDAKGEGCTTSRQGDDDQSGGRHQEHGRHKTPPDHGQGQEWRCGAHRDTRQRQDGQARSRKAGEGSTAARTDRKGQITQPSYIAKRGRARPHAHAQDRGAQAQDHDSGTNTGSPDERHGTRRLSLKCSSFDFKL